MSNIEVQEAFELEINTLDQPLEKPKTRDIQLWLMSAIYKFVNTRYSGFNIKGTGFEETQKRTDDLRKLVSKLQYEFTVPEEEYEVPLPSQYMRSLGETTYIASSHKCWPTKDGQPIQKPTDVLEATIENFDRLRSNSLSEYRLKNNNARPIRLQSNDKIRLYTDGNYYIKKYVLTYLRLPLEINLNNPSEVYSDLPEDALREVIKMAASMYLENQANPRYESHSNEINSME